MSRTILMFAGLWTVLLGIDAYGDDAHKLNIRIEFSVGHQDWEEIVRDDAFENNEEEEAAIATLHRETSDKLAEVFNEWIQFVEFVTDPSVATDLTLKISIVQKGSRSTKSFDLRLELHGLSDQFGIKRVDLEFRETGASYTVSKDFIKSESAAKLAEHLEASTNRVVDNCLEYAALTDRIMMVQRGDSTVAVLPWQHSDIGAADTCVFKIQTLDSDQLLREHITKRELSELLGGLSELPDPFKNGMVIKDHDDPKNSLQLIPFDPEENMPTLIEGFYVTFYERFLGGSSDAEASETNNPASFRDPDTEE